MGEMADWDIDNGITPDEEYDWEWDREETERRAKRIPKTCRICGQTGLFWEQYQGKWRLHDKDDELHDCRKQPEPPKPKPKPAMVVINEYMEFPYGQLRIAVIELRDLIRKKEHISEYDIDRFAEALTNIGNDLVRGQAIQEYRMKNE